MGADLIKEAGLTDGEAKVYLALLKLGSTTTGPIIEESGVANSIIYKLLESLINKGLASYVIKGKIKYFQAAEPKRILDYIEERKKKLDVSKEKIENLLPQLMTMMSETEQSSVKLYEGWKGFLTAWELYHSRLKKGEEYHSWGVYPVQEKRFHLYWMRDHEKRRKLGIKGKILFNKGTDSEILKNRNSYKGMDCRYMPTDIKTPAWFVVYKDVVGIFLQKKNPLVVQIINQDIADSFEAYFQDMWKKTKPFK
ncbi:TrmB family transcriptional regulator [Nanoarchaeota archaeon]